MGAGALQWSAWLVRGQVETVEAREAASEENPRRPTDAMLAVLAVASAALAPSLPCLARAPPPPRRAALLVASESLAVTTSKALVGLAAQPVCALSLAALSSTGCGLRGELPATLEGLAYAVVAGFALSSLFTRATTGSGLLEAELAAAAAERAVLERIDAGDDPLRGARIDNMERKADGLANGPTARLLAAAELSSVATAAAALLVFGYRLASDGALPSAVPIAGGACWGP